MLPPRTEPVRRPDAEHLRKSLMRAPRVLAIGAVDPTGRTGLGNDVAVLESEGVEASIVPTCLLVQDAENSHHVEPIQASLIQAALGAVARFDKVRSIKVGLIPHAAGVETVLAFLTQVEAPVVLDPILYASTGAPLSVDETGHLLRSLCGRATLVTANGVEAEAITGLRVAGPSERVRAARFMQELGAKGVLLQSAGTGGRIIHDLLVTDRVRLFERPRLDLSARGVGRRKGGELSARIAGLLAKGVPIEPAVSAALERLHARLQAEALAAQHAAPRAAATAANS